MAYESRPHGFEDWRAGDERGPRGSRRRRDEKSKRHGGGSAESETEVDDAVSVGEALAREHADTEEAKPKDVQPVATTTPEQAETPGPLEVPEPAVPDTTGEVEVIPAAARPRRGGRPRFTVDTDPASLDQRGLYQLRSLIEKKLTGPEQAAALQRIDLEARRRGDEVRAAQRRGADRTAAATAEVQSVAGDAEKTPVGEVTAAGQVEPENIPAMSEAPAPDTEAAASVPDTAPAGAAVEAAAVIPPGTFEASPVEPVAEEPAREELDESSKELLQLIAQARSGLRPDQMTDEQQREMRTLYDWLGQFDAKVRSGEGRDVATSSEFWQAMTAMNARRIENGLGDPAELGPQLEQAYGRYLEHDDPAFLENFHPSRNAYTLETLSKVRGANVAVGLYGKLTEKLRRLGVPAADSRLTTVSGGFHNLLLRRAGELSARLSELPAEEQERFTTMSKDFNQPPNPAETDKRIEQVAGYIKALEAALAPKEAARAPLADKRQAYAKALRSQSKILFGRTSKQELETRRGEYQTAIAEEVQKKIDEIKAEFQGLPADPAREAELNGKITELVLTSRTEEENALVTAMKDSVEQSAAQRFQRYWKKHTKARLVIGLGLLGGVAASTLTGQFALAAGLQGLRVPMSGVGGTMTIESLAEIARSKFGQTKEIKSEEDIKKLDDDELERRLAAHETSFADIGGKEFGVKARGVWKKRQDATGQRLLAEYRSRHEQGIKEIVTDLQAKGKAPDEIVAKVLEASLDEQRAHHAALEERRASDRRFTVVKWTTAVLGGAALATLSGLGAIRHAKRAVEHGQDMAGQVSKTAGRAARAMQEARVGPVPDTTQAAAADTARVAASADTSQVEVARAAAASDVPPAAADHEESIRQFHLDRGDGADVPKKSWGDLRMQDATLRTPTPEEVASMQATKEAYEAQQAAATGADHGDTASAAATTAEAAEAKASAIETVKKGDSVWKIVERQLHERLGEKFDGLDEARQTYMIDALKDRVVEHHADFGLDNPDQLEVGDKLDLSRLFEGTTAADLGHLHEQATALDQQAVAAITQHNEQLREWVQAHPHQALNAEDVLSAKATTVAEHGAGASEPILSEHVQQAWVDKVSGSLRQQMLCDLAEKYPEEYAKAHAANPDLYPDVAGTHLEAVAGGGSEQVNLIHLSHDGLEAQKQFSGAMKSFYENTPRPAADGIIKRVTEMSAGEAMKKGALEKAIDEMEGGTHDRARKLASAIRKLLKSVPKHEYAKTEKLKAIFARIPEAKK